ncbi:MAG: tetraacyldisaccharide 4'-kinase [Mariprofundus sp.]
MGGLHGYIEKIWWRRQTPPLWLRLFEPIYAAISHQHLNKRANHITTSPLPIISIGNITVGGSGKTPFTLWLAAALVERGMRPVILCRGDGGSTTGAAIVDALDETASAGDEACMLARAAPCPVIAAQDRIAGSQLAVDLGDLIILDDGFQYRHLARCCDIVLIPAEGVGNGHQLPAGPLREPLTTLSRADLVVRTSNQSQQKIPPLWSNREWQWQAKAGPLLDIHHTGETPPEQVYAATAIARPQRFFDDLHAMGISLISTKTWPDHHRFSKQDIQALLAQHLPVAVTAKDAVKLTASWPAERALWVLQQHGEGEVGLLDAIIRQIPPRKDFLNRE